MITTFSEVMSYLIYGVTIALALSGLVASGLAALTRDDAFEVADRQNKWIWVAILILSSAAVILRLPFVSWIGLVVIGLYWFDVRPQLKDILDGNYGWR